MEEIWKIAVEYEKYEISNFGNLRNGEKIIKGCINGSGYRFFHLKRNNKNKNYRFHCLVAKAFIGERPEGLVIDHINRNKLDNRVENLRYITQKQNSINSSKYRIDVERDENGRIIRNKGINRRNGSLHILSSGTWNVRIMRENIKYTKTFKSKEEAEEYLNCFS